MKWVRLFLPSPLSIAVVLTLITAILALIFTDAPQNQIHIISIAKNWHSGIWELLTFTMQMMLMLVLGHTIALSPIASSFSNRVASLCKTNAHAAILVTFFSLVAGYFNWGLGLILGAVLARKVGEYAKTQGIALNYPLIAACGYTSLMVWHGGLSGSAPLTVSSPDHSLIKEIGLIPSSETIFALPNITAVLATLILIPLFGMYLAKRPFSKSYPSSIKKTSHKKSQSISGAEVLDHSPILGLSFGCLLLALWVYLLIDSKLGLGYINLNTINFLLFGLAISCHKSLSKFMSATESAIKGSTGILIQFPLYAGIMGIMKYSGLLEVFAHFFIDISNHDTFPFFAYLSSAIVNVLVPSGGGQWQVQGPILVEAAQTLGVSIPKTVMALSYGDQLTNMLQPFWALPLLGITGLKAKDILPYSILFMLIGGSIFLCILYLF